MSEKWATRWVYGCVWGSVFVLALGLVWNLTTRKLRPSVPSLPPTTTAPAAPRWRVTLYAETGAKLRTWETADEPQRYDDTTVGWLGCTVVGRTIVVERLPTGENDGQR